MKEILTSISSTKNNMSLRITLCDSFHWYGYLTALRLKAQILYMLIQRLVPMCILIKQFIQICFRRCVHSGLSYHYHMTMEKNECCTYRPCYHFDVSSFCNLFAFFYKKVRLVQSCFHLTFKIFFLPLTIKNERAIGHITHLRYISLSK